MIVPLNAEDRGLVVATSSCGESDVLVALDGITQVSECLQGSEHPGGTAVWALSEPSPDGALPNGKPAEVSGAGVFQRVFAARGPAMLGWVRWKMHRDRASLTTEDLAVLAETERWSAQIGACAHLFVVCVIGSIVLVAFDTEHHSDPIVTALLLADLAVSLFGVFFARRARVAGWLSWAAGLLDVTVLTAVVIETVRFELTTPGPFKATLVVIWGVFLSFSLSAMRGRPILLLVQTTMFALSLIYVATGLADALHPSAVVLSGSLVTFFDPAQSAIRIAVIVLAGLMLIVATLRARINLRHAIVASRRAATLSRYMAPSVAAVVANTDVEALQEGRQQDVAVLFCDVRGFSTLAETMPPREIANFLNMFRRLAVAAIEGEGGVVDKFIGDEVMGLFGVPTVTPYDAGRAVRAAQRLLAFIETWSLERMANGHPPVSVGVGIHYGPVFAGVLGENRLEFTVLGSTVNIARRLEELTKSLDQECIASAQAIRAARTDGSGNWVCRHLPAQTIRGHSEPVEVFAVVDG